MTFSPLEVEVVTDMQENQSKNPLILFNWVFFSLVLSGLITFIIPFLKLLTIILVPKRVHSKSQKEYAEKIERMFSDNKKDHYL